MVLKVELQGLLAANRRKPAIKRERKFIEIEMENVSNKQFKRVYLNKILTSIFKLYTTIII